MYRPPRNPGSRTQLNARKIGRATRTKLWLVCLIDYYRIPEAEKDKVTEIEKRAHPLLRDSRKCELINFHWPHRPKMADELEMGDWIIQCVRDRDGNIYVEPPARLISIEKYIRNPKTGKERYIFNLESPKGGQSMEWKAFTKSANAVLSNSLNTPRTRPIRNTDEADGLLRLWTPAGRISRRKNE